MLESYICINQHKNWESSTSVLFIFCNDHSTYAYFVYCNCLSDWIRQCVEILVSMILLNIVFGLINYFVFQLLFKRDHYFFLNIYKIFTPYFSITSKMIYPCRSNLNTSSNYRRVFIIVHAIFQCILGVSIEVDIQVSFLRV